MRKISTIAVIVIAVILLAYPWRKGMNELNKLQPEGIIEVFFANPVSNYTITDSENASILLNVLKSDTLKRKFFAEQRAGFGFIIEVKSDGEKLIEITVSSDCIIINNQAYTITPEYYENIEKVFNQLSKIYPVSEA